MTMGPWVCPGQRRRGDKRRRRRAWSGSSRPRTARTNSAALAYDVIDGYAWWVMPAENAADVAPDLRAAGDGRVVDGFAPLAARRLILGTMQREGANLDQNSALDRLHAIAVDQSIVTPYSSMIVLVTTQQQNLLKQLSPSEDRFRHREYEAVGETALQDPLVTGVPEPKEECGCSWHWRRVCWPGLRGVAGHPSGRWGHKMRSTEKSA